MPEQLYTKTEILEELDNIDFEEESDARGPVLEATLRELYNLPNIKQDESAIRAAIEYSNLAQMDLDDVKQYAARFELFYKDWEEAAEEHLLSMIGQEIKTYLPYIDLDRLGRGLKDDEGFCEVSDGRIACFKKEGE
jgi:hypothetical protein